jgi:hypothetical protein
MDQRLVIVAAAGTQISGCTNPDAPYRRPYYSPLRRVRILKGHHPNDDTWDIYFGPFYCDITYWVVHIYRFDFSRS